MVDAVAPAAPAAGPRPQHDVLVRRTGRPALALAWGRLVLLVGARAYRALLISLVVVATLPLLWSWTTQVVRTGSMEPSIGVGDVVVARPFTSAEDVPVGRVMVFADPADPARERLLVHRVVGAADDGGWTTAGDANASLDSTPVTRDDFRSRAMILVPYVGQPVVWFTDGDVVPLLLWLVLTALAFAVTARRDPYGKDPRGRPLKRLARRATRRHRRVTTVEAALRVAIAPVLALGLLGGAAVATGATANAAFTATTASRDSSWTVSTSLATRVSLAPPADAVRGTVPLTASLTGAGTGYSVRIDYAPAGTTTWRTVCTRATAPFTCDWSTTALTNQAYDLRAVAVSGTTSLVSDLVEDVLVDNAAPSVVMQDPGSPLRGVVTLTASAADAHSGVDRVVVQYAATGTTTWRDVCTSEDEPATCRLDTTTIPDGSYALRAVATDAAGNATTSNVVGGRTVDNRVASVSVTDPGAFLSGTVQLGASAYAPAGVASVRLQRAPSGGTAWTDICTDPTSPYACAWDTTTVVNGLYDLRAVLTDTAGRLTTSAVLTARRVDNSPVRAADVQTVQGGAVAGRVDQGDRLVLTYSGLVRTTSISAGWTGAATPVTVRLRDGNLLGLGSNGDTLDVSRGGATVALGSVNLRQNFIKSLRTAQLAATMTATTVTVNGVSATQVTIVLGVQTSGSGLPTASVAAAMVWSPTTTALDVNGRAVSATPATETGTADRDF
ncbi:MAG: fibronectin type domain protein [Nocardioides sp.]|nr:fibronectin type domain protein [Nocardioides sp.]